MLARCGKRHALFLQGTGSLFFSRLARKLEGVGVETSKIHLCVGDHLFWYGRKSTSYRGSFKNWKRYITTYISENEVSDVVLFSDSRPYHAVATEVAKSLGINVFVFENGYLRPNWITMEQGGVNGRTGFPSEPEEIYKLAKEVSRSTQTYQEGTAGKPLQLYFGDTTFHTLNFLLAFVFPGYTGYRKVSALAEARGWIKKAWCRSTKVKRSESALKKLMDSDTPFFFFPLQLEHDYQLKVDSPFDSIGQASNEVIASFAKHAPLDVKLLVKNHPLDNNTIDREVETLQLARKYGVENRVVFIEAGPNPTILDKTAGMITINSTMGTSALFHSAPMCVLGNAIYKVKGLVHAGGLDSFWITPQRPDQHLCKVFSETLIDYCQIQGHYCENDLNAGSFEHSMAKILATPFQLPQHNISNIAVETAEKAVIQTENLLPDPENPIQVG